MRTTIRAKCTKSLALPVQQLSPSHSNGAFSHIRTEQKMQRFDSETRNRLTFLPILGTSGGGRVGLRRRFKAPISSEARVRIPSFAFCSFEFGTVFVFSSPLLNAHGAWPTVGRRLDLQRFRVLQSGLGGGSISLFKFFKFFASGAA